MTIKRPTRFTHFDELLAVRMAAPVFTLTETTALPSIDCESTNIFVDDLLELGFIYSHEFIVDNAVGKDEGDSSRVIAYMNAEENTYALLTDLYHEEFWVYFTSFFPDGRRFITTSQPGALGLDFLEPAMPHLEILNVGSTPIASQWKRHKRMIATEVPEAESLLYKPAQHLASELQFYQDYIAELQTQNVLQLSDTQTIRFTRSGARIFHLALSSRSAKRPKPRVEEWIGRRGKLPIKSLFSPKKMAVAAGLAAIVGIAAMYQQGVDFLPTRSSGEASDAATAMAPVVTPTETLPGTDNLSSDEVASVDAPQPTATDTDAIAPGSAEGSDRQKILIANQEDEMWRIAVENAEFFLLSNDGDPAPWVRMARKIAAGFSSNDSRLARTYFLSALLEPDYRIAEQQFNRALSIQTKTLGLYHTETAQTLEALAWIAEHNKDDLEEAITHQRLAINIYRDIFGADQEDTKAAEWKLDYFEDRLAGVRPKAESNRRLLPALARFTR